jgi:dolichol kinase
MVFNTLTTPVTILFMINGLLHLANSINLKKRFPKQHNMLNSVSIFFLWIIAGLLYPVIYPSGPEYLILQTISNIIIVFLTPISIILLFTAQHFIIKRKPYLMSHRSIEGVMQRFKENEDKLKALGKDLYRKSLHFIPPALIFLLLAMSNQYGKELGISLMLTVGYSLIVLISAIDFVRLSYIYGKKRLDHLMPETFSKILEKTMKKREMYESIKVVPLILGMLPALFFPFSIFLSVALVSTISDGAASVFGHFIGRFHFPKNSKKTVSGYIAGATITFFLILFTCSVTETTWSGFKLICLSFVGMSTFLLIDMFCSRIDDNVLNPLLTSLSLGLTSLVLL